MATVTHATLCAFASDVARALVCDLNYRIGVHVYLYIPRKIDTYCQSVQVKDAVLTEEVYCSPEASVLLASYAIQAEVGLSAANTCTHDHNCIYLGMHHRYMYTVLMYIIYYCL